MRARSTAFVDTSAWGVLALRRDPLHARAVTAWEQMAESRPRIVTSVPVISEIVTFLERHTSRDVALKWKDSLDSITKFSVLVYTEGNLRDAWQ